ncbi:MAG: hypothetical protein RLZZ301_1053 [Bacteroidota bacterium]|jgi:hypothetical protein
MRLALSFVAFFYTTALVAQHYAYKEAITTLCSAPFAGRGYVDNGAQQAAQFIESEFKAIGLKPKGKKGYKQAFHYSVQTFPGACQLIAGTDTLKAGIDYLIDPASAGTSGKQTYQLVYCKTATLLQSTSSFKPCPPGRMLVVQTSGFGGDTIKILKARLKELSKFAPVLELNDEKLTWSVSQSATPYPLLHAVLSKWPSQVNSCQLELEARMLPNFQTHNVIGFLPASTEAKSKETIVLSAHYDHLGKMGQQAYFPGANDNASGVGMLLYLAHELARQNERSVNYVFIAFSGEEAGLIGSKYFTEHPTFDLKKIRFVLNLDIMGSGEEGITVVNATKFPTEFERLVQLNQQHAALTQVKSRGPAANSDHYFFTELGIPSFFIYTMGPNKHYHDIEDRAEELSYAAFEPLATLLLEFLRSF